MLYRLCRLCIPVAVLWGASPALSCSPPAAVWPRGDEAVAQAGAVIERAEAAYRELRFYRDTAIVRHESEPIGDSRGAQAHEESLEFRFARPNLFILRNERGGAYCDGARLWLHDATSGVYSEWAAPATVRLDDLDRRVPAVHLGSHPVACALLGRGPALPAWRVDEVTGVAAELRAGAPGFRVHALGRGDIPGQDRSPMSLWFSERPLLEEVGVDLTEAFRAANEVRGPGAPADEQRGPAVQRVTVTTRLIGVRIDEPMGADEFAFRPGPSDRRADDISSPIERARAAEGSMIGQSAPRIEQPTLDGGPFALSQTAGRVVVLYFWDTGCAVSADGLPLVQAMANRFLAEPVTVLCVNQDAPAGVDRVRRRVAHERVSIGQVMDSEGAVSRSFALAGFPCTVIIDKEGIIRVIDPGSIAQREDAITSEVRALLRGEEPDDPPTPAPEATGSR